MTVYAVAFQLCEKFYRFFPVGIGATGATDVTVAVVVGAFCHAFHAGADMLLSITT